LAAGSASVPCPGPAASAGYGRPNRGRNRPSPLADLVLSAAVARSEQFAGTGDWPRPDHTNAARSSGAWSASRCSWWPTSRVRSWAGDRRPPPRSNPRGSRLIRGARSPNSPHDHHPRTRNVVNTAEGRTAPGREIPCTKVRARKPYLRPAPRVALRGNIGQRGLPDTKHKTCLGVR
jgi:hypothetical protein